MTDRFVAVYAIDLIFCDFIVFVSLYPFFGQPQAVKISMATQT